MAEPNSIIVNSEEPLLTTEQVAAILVTKPQTLEIWRTSKRYPLPYVKIGRNVRYRKSDVIAFINARTVAA